MSANWGDVIAQIRDLEAQHRAEKAKVKELCERIAALEDGVRDIIIDLPAMLGKEDAEARLKALIPTEVHP